MTVKTIKLVVWVMWVVLVVTAAPSVASAQMVILVRHAERADGGAPAANAMTTPADPELSAVGKARALTLAAMLKDAGVTKIFTTQYKRTIDTAAPLAGVLTLTPETIESRDQASLVAKIKANTAGAVLVVGHSNSVPAIIKALGGPDVTIGESEYDSLFFLAPGGVLTRVRFQP